ncbi:MAG: N-acetyltransferase, partial [Anaerolineae bacterium]|nr:N-acetyltransferase [Anaerolineae bacterium]
MIIRNETPKDYKIVSATNASSFNTEAAANLVEELRQMEKPHISLVAEEDGFLIEHS